jgi:hypothetical protein
VCVRHHRDPDPKAHAKATKYCWSIARLDFGQLSKHTPDVMINANGICCVIQGIANYTSSLNKYYNGHVPLWVWALTRSMGEVKENPERERVSCVAGISSPGQAFLSHKSLLAYIPYSRQEVVTHHKHHNFDLSTVPTGSNPCSMFVALSCVTSLTEQLLRTVAGEKRVSERARV